jgi:serine protease Do
MRTQHSLLAAVACAALCFTLLGNASGPILAQPAPLLSPILDSAGPDSPAVTSTAARGPRSATPSDPRGTMAFSPAALGNDDLARPSGRLPGGSMSASWNPRQTPVVEVVRRVREAVVNIHSERTVRNSGDDALSLTPSQNRVNGMGTGILIDSRGYVVTNQHVVEDVSLIRVRLADGSTSAARVLARDHECDLALLKIEVDHPLPTIPLGTTRDLMVGETVVAIGNAYGYEHTVTVGVVSAVARDVTLNKEVSYKALIQTDASINPGNSGGPLLNIYGELVGVNVAIRAGAQGIGFAIPVDTMIRVAARMLGSSGGATRHGDLGLSARDDVRLPQPGAAPGETAPLRCCVVESLDPSGPAATAGVQRGDVLLRVDDLPVSCLLDVERGLLDHPAGDRVTLVFRRAHSLTAERRGGNSAVGAEREGEQRAEVALVAARSYASASSERSRSGGGSEDGPAPEKLWRRIGLRLAPVGADSVVRANPQLRGGLGVTDVREGSAASRAGIEKGDILVGLHQWEMLSLDNVQYVLNHPDLASFLPLRFYILRGGQVHRGWLQLSP